MNPLLLVAIVGVAAAALGLGSLSNTISLDVQQLGVGETNLETPLTNADVDFVIARAAGVVTDDCTINSTDDCVQTHNVIDVCDIHVATGQIPAGSTVYCKLTDIDGNVVAEGTESAPDTLNPSDHITVEIDPDDFPNNKVQNIHDLVVVVQGP